MTIGCQSGDGLPLFTPPAIIVGRRCPRSCPDSRQTRPTLNSAARLPELTELEAILHDAGSRLHSRVLCEVSVGERRLPLHAITLGNPSPEVPAVGFFGGIHGLERIGAEVVLAFLRSLVNRLEWDELLHRQLQTLRLVFMPLVNPGGFALGTRANPRGVDLMRNAPVDAREQVPLLIGGQRLSSGMPWYRGAAGAPMEDESSALCALVESELLSHPFSLSIDCHSGFGVQDRIWFPYAHTREPIANLADIHALHGIFEQSQIHHPYIFEPQSLQYLTHGDLWDHLYLQALRRQAGIFLPLTLEMGSWMWIKKNPRQLLSRHGMFNPLIAHRQQRVMRRHQSLLDFFMRAASAWKRWVPDDTAVRNQHRERALRRWYKP